MVRRRSASLDAMDPARSRVVLALTVAAAGLGASVLPLGPRRLRPSSAIAARQLGAYLAHIVFSATMSEIAALIGRDASTVAHACRVVEDRRDDPAFDVVVSVLERGLARASILQDMEC